MPQAAVLQTTNIGVETTKGTAVAATKRLRSISIVPQINPEITAFRAQGYLINNLTVLNREWTTAAVTGQPTYDEIIYALASVIGNVTPTQPDVPNSPTVYQWDFDLSSNSAQDPATFTVESQGPDRSGRFAYAWFNSFNLNIARNAISMGGSMMGAAWQDGVVPSGSETQTLTITGTPDGGTFTLTFDGDTTAAIAFDATASAVQAALELLDSIGTGNVICSGGPLPDTAVVIGFTNELAGTDQALITADDTNLTGGTTPSAAVVETAAGSALTEIPLIPIIPTQINVYVDDTAGAIGTTQMTRNFVANLTIPDRYGTIWPLNRDLDSFAEHVAVAIDGTQLMLQFERDEVGMAFLSTMRAGATKYIRVEAVGDTISDDETYGMTLDFVGQINAGSMGENSDLATVDWTFTAVDDATLPALSFSVTNTQASL